MFLSTYGHLILHMLNSNVRFSNSISLISESGASWMKKSSMRLRTTSSIIKCVIQTRAKTIQMSVALIVTFVSHRVLAREESMKRKHTYQTSGRTIFLVVRDWLTSRGLELENSSGSVTDLSWCGRHAVRLSETEYQACRVELADWVVDELIQCDRIDQVGLVTIVRTREGLRDLVPIWAKVFDARTKDLRITTWELENAKAECIATMKAFDVYEKKVLNRLCITYARLPVETVFGI